MFLMIKPRNTLIKTAAQKIKDEREKLKQKKIMAFKQQLCPIQIQTTALMVHNNVKYKIKALWWWVLIMIKIHQNHR